MNLATLKDGSRDGQLLVVSRDQQSAATADAIAPTLQRVLDDWSFYAPQLEDLYQALNQGRARYPFRLEPAHCMAPLPRAYQRVQGAAYLNHLELQRRAAGASVPARWRVEPLLRYGASDPFLGPTDVLTCDVEAGGINFEAQLAVVTDDVACGTKPQTALSRVRLVLLASVLTLRAPLPTWGSDESDGFYATPSVTFAPVAVTPDELSPAWRDGRLNCTLWVERDGQAVGQADYGVDMDFDFRCLIARAARMRSLSAGCVVSSGAVSNRKPVLGYTSIVDQACREIIESKRAVTAFLQHGERIRIDARDAHGRSIFGVIDQALAPASAAYDEVPKCRPPSGGRHDCAPYLGNRRRP